MADALSDYAEKKLIDHLLGTATYTKPSAVYVALLTANATDSSNGTEVSGGSYARQAASFNAASTDTNGNSTASNASALTFTSLPSATIVGVAVFDAATGGNLLTYGALGASKTVTSGDTFTISAGQLTLQLQ